MFRSYTAHITSKWRPLCTQVCIKTYGKILWDIPKNFVFCKFLKILMVSDKTMHKAIRFYKTLCINKAKVQNPSEIFFLHFLPNLYIGFKIPQVLFYSLHVLKMGEIWAWPCTPSTLIAGGESTVYHCQYQITSWIKYILNDHIEIE